MQNKKKIGSCLNVNIRIERPQSDTLVKMWNFIKEFGFPYKKYYLFGLLALIATTFVTTLIPLEIKNAINAIEVHQISKIPQIILTTVILSLILIIVRSLSRILIFIPGRNIEHDVRNTVFEHLLKLPSRFYQNRKIGDLMSVIINDAQSLRATAAMGFLHIANTILIFIFVFYQMSKLNLPLAFCVLLPIPAAMLIVKHYVKTLFSAISENQKNLGEITNFCVETLTSIHLIKSFAKEETIESYSKSVNDAYEKSTLNVAKIRSKMVPFIGIIGSIGHWTVFTVGGYLIIHDQLKLGDFAAYLGYVEMLAWPTASLAWIINITQRGNAAIKRINEIRSVPTEKTMRIPKNHSNQHNEGSRIEFNNLTFNYPSQEKSALSNITLSIKKGDRVGIFGPTGSGKTTLVNILCGFEPIQKSQVFIDDEDITLIPLDTLQEKISLASQSPHIFSESIENNIHYSPSGSQVSDESNQGYANKASLLKDIAAFPHHFKTMTGEKGVMLSGGQKSRLALARAFHKPHTLLILDDVLSAVDHDTEYTLISHIFSTDMHSTKLIVSHRVSALTYCDTIIVLDHGKIIDQGSHADLIKRPGSYHTTWQHQQQFHS